MATCAPSSASTWAQARPRPLLAPPMMATLPFNPRSIPYALAVPESGSGFSTRLRRIIPARPASQHPPVDLLPRLHYPCAMPLGAKQTGGTAGEGIVQSLDEAGIREIERHAVELARGAGEILSGYFGRRIGVEFKDDKERDPVTTADKQTQAYLAAEIARRFPDHGVLGEEATEEEKQSEEPARDILWVLDPLDGTTNFLNGLPVFASSIGVIHRGRPVAAALYIPWPADGGGFVLHCRKGGGCYADDEPVKVLETEQPIPNRLIGLPGYFGVANRFTGGLAGKEGEPRTTGSIAYELAMTARGVMQYGILRRSKNVGHGGRRARGPGSGRHGHDSLQRRPQLASHRQLRPHPGRKRPPP